MNKGGDTDRQWHRRELLDGAGEPLAVIWESHVECLRVVRGRRSGFLVLRS